MDFLPAELIRKKRFGQAHTQEEIRFLVQGFARGEIPDYQMAAWLMAICCRSMNVSETAWLTQEMRDSGEVIDLKNLGVTVDKHSTGGVGDKTSLLLAPIVAAAGVPVPMMAGRGLGHTGGTLDKLESIAGFDVGLGFAQFKKQVAAVGTAIISQTAEICPADRKLYALRDVTGTIDSLPLICGSIMSKKLAEGMSALVLDVKVGSGAFMKTLEEAEVLAHALIDIGRQSDRKVVALLTRMDEPLGRFVGNALEVGECLDILNQKQRDFEGKDYSDTIELTLSLAGQMIFLGGKASSPSDGEKIAMGLMQSGRAGEKFVELCRWQNGDPTQSLPMAPERLVMRSRIPGFMRYFDLEKIGSAAIVLGAGRRFLEDVIAPGAGIEVFRRQGDAVQAGDPLFTLFAADQQRLSAGEKIMQQSYEISGTRVVQSPLVHKVIT